MKSKFGLWKFLVGYWIFSSIPPLAPLPCAAAGWLQVQGGPRHTGCVETPVAPPFKTLWARNLNDEIIHSAAQVMTDGIRAYAATFHANAYALEMETGDIAWQTSLHGPVMSSCALDETKAFFATMYGAVHALDKTDGKTLWEWNTPDKTGISASPCLSGGRMHIGTRGGSFFCLDCATGKVIWERDIGAPVVQTAAMDGERVYFGAEDMRAYCLDAGSGEILWRTDPFSSGQTFRDYWPVVGEKVAIFTVMPACSWMETFVSRDNFKVEDGLVEDENWRDLELKDLGEKIRRLTNYITNNRQWQSTFVLDKKTGKEAFVLPILYCSGAGCTQTPPAIHRDGTIYFKYLYTPYGVSPGALLGRAKEDGTGIESLPGFEQIGGGWGLDALRGPNWKPPAKITALPYCGDQPLVMTLGGDYIYGSCTWDYCPAAYLQLETLDTGGLQSERHPPPDKGNYVNMNNYECAPGISVCPPYLISRDLGKIICVKSEGSDKNE